MRGGIKKEGHTRTVTVFPSSPNLEPADHTLSGRHAPLVAHPTLVPELGLGQGLAKHTTKRDPQAWLSHQQEARTG